MAKGRMLNKSISTSRKLARVDDKAMLIYILLNSHTDDYGRMEGDAVTVQAKVVPTRKYTEEDVEKGLDALQEVGLILRYEVEGEQYVEIVGFEENQSLRSDRPRKQEYPEPTVSQRDTKDTQSQTTGEKRRRKLSQAKLSQAKLYTTAKAAVTKNDPKLISDIIKGFEAVNPSSYKLYGMNPQRKAIDRMLEAHGEEKIRSVIAYLPKSNATKYAPTITTPYQLETNLGKLLAWAQKQRDSGKGKELIL